MSRPACSVVLLTPQRMLRADVARDGSLHAPAEWARERPDGSDFADHAELALRLGGPAGKTLWVLASDVWTQTLTLPSGAAAAASPDALQTALALEVEASSGVPAYDARVGYTSLGDEAGESRFWVTLVPGGQLAALEEIASRAGTRLAGVVHPGGLPERIEGGGGGDWDRLEVWEEVLFDLREEGGRRSLDVEPGGTLAHLPPSSAAHRELLLDEGVSAPEGEALRVDLGRPEDLRRWLQAWGARLTTRGAEGLPLVTAPKRPMSAGSRLIVSVIAFCAVVLGCAAHYGSLERERVEIERRLTLIQEPAQVAAQFETTERTLRGELQELERETQTLTGIEQRYRTLTAAHRRRHARLLRALAEVPVEVRVGRLSDVGRALTIEGSAPNPQAPTALATELAHRLEGSGWRVLAPEVTSEGGSWYFSLELRDVAPAPTQGAPR